MLDACLACERPLGRSRKPRVSRRPFSCSRCAPPHSAHWMQGTLLCFLSSGQAHRSYDQQVSHRPPAKQPKARCPPRLRKCKAQKTKARAEHGLGVLLADQRPCDHWPRSQSLLGSSFLCSGSSVRSGISSSLGSVSSSGASILGSVLGGISSVAGGVSGSSTSVLGSVSSSSASILGSVSGVGSSIASSVSGVLGSIGSGVGSVLGGFNSRCGCRSGSFHRSGCWRRSSSFFLLAAGGQSNSSDQRCENNGLLHLDIPNDGGFLCFKPEANDSPRQRVRNTHSV